METRTKLDCAAAIFVYGTLKRGQLRQHSWPFPPLEVEFATLTAALYDLGPYPAIAAGSDTILGELWWIRKEHLTETMSRLDQIEGYEPGGDSLYIRQQVVCQLESGEEVSAQTYFYANVDLLSSSCRMLPGIDGTCQWPP